MIRTPRSTGVHDALASLRALPLLPTPLLPLEIDGVRLHAKVESLQPVGAFKIRGAWWRLSSLSASERDAGVVAVSSGNHAQGVAWAAKRLGIEATIVMPRDAPPVKIEATKTFSARKSSFTIGRERTGTRSRLPCSGHRAARWSMPSATPG